jgi:predicted enzyme related to lactoylglutathione lyase
MSSPPSCQPDAAGIWVAWISTPGWNAGELRETLGVAVRRIVPDIGFGEPEKAKAFYRDVLGLDIAMDQGWIVTFKSKATASPQVSIMSEGGSGAPVPDISIEVDDVDAVYARAKSAGCEIIYAITDEPWGIRRFFVRDPAGKMLNILAHDARSAP